MALQNSTNLYPENYDVTVTSGKNLWLNGPGVISGLFKAGETNRRITIKWNASEGTSEVFQGTGDPATRILIGAATADGVHFVIARSTVSGTAGNSITWEDLLSVSGVNLTYKGSQVARANTATTFTAAQQFDSAPLVRANLNIRAIAATPNPALLFQNTGGSSVFSAQYNATGNRLDIGIAGTNTAGILKLTPTTEATAYNASAGVQIDGGVAVAKKLFAKELHSNDAISYSAAPPITQVLSYASVRQLTVPAIYTSSTNGSASVNGTYVGGSGFTVVESDPYAIASISNSGLFQISLDLVGDYECEFQSTVARTSSDLLSTIRAGLRFDGVDYGFQQLNVSGDSVILTRVTASKIFNVATAGKILRPIFNVVSQNSNDVEIRAADTELKIRYLGR